MSEAIATPSDRSALGPVLTIGVLFFIFGFVTWLNGPLITFVKLAFNLDDVNAFLVPMAFYLSYFFLALPASAILRRTGMKNGMALGLFVMAVGAVLFGHFTTMRVYPGALTGLFVIGAGLALLQTASNPYISILEHFPCEVNRKGHRGISSGAQIRFRSFVVNGGGRDGEGVLERSAGAGRCDRRVGRERARGGTAAQSRCVNRDPLDGSLDHHWQRRCIARHGTLPLAA